MNLALKSRLLLKTGLPAGALLLVTAVCSAAPGELTQVPLFLSNMTKPNLLLALDDSQSMDYELSMPSNDGALWWYVSDQSFTGRNRYNSIVPGIINVNNTGVANWSWKQFVYLFPNGYNSTYNGKRMLNDSSDSFFALPPVDAYAYARSPDYNKIYYDPAITYTPWPSRGSYTFSNADPSAALYDPVYTSAGSLDLTTDFDNSNPHWGDWNWKFKFFAGMRDENNLVVGAETLRSVAYFPATYYRPAGSTDSSGYSADPSCSTCKAPDGSLMDKYEIKPGNYSSGTAYDAAIKNFANWFTYYRRRHQAMRASVAKTVDTQLATRAGIFTTNNRTTVSMYDLDNAGDKAGLYDRIYVAVGNNLYSPNRSSIAHAGEQLQRTDGSAPIQYSCQQNATLLATDGFSGNYTPSSYTHNYDGNNGSPYSDSYSGTIGDVAMKFYESLSNSGSVPPDSACGISGHVPWLDCSTEKHMNTFALNIGGTGFKYGDGYNIVQDAYRNPPSWRSPNTSRSQDQVDDLYHAVVNAHGEIYDSHQTSALAGRLSRFQHPAAAEGSAAAASFSTSSITANTSVYLPSLNSAGWSGDLDSWHINSDGSVGSHQWSAADLLDARSLTNNPRSIVTYNETQAKGVSFEWSSLDTDMKNDLRTDSRGDIETSDDIAKERLLFLRGKRSCEWGSSTGCSVTANLRKRSSRLGDIIHSSAVYVGKPNLNWPTTSPFPTSQNYQTYEDTMKDRMGMVYVGGNDGMLHGFRADTGEEQFSYIPGALYASGNADGGLHYLAQPDYAHQNYVDDTPSVSDAWLGGEWKTILVGGLRNGGRTVYALDVTHPETMDNQTTAASKVMWEFSNPDLGYGFGQPVIVPLGDASGIEWYVVFANGYNDPSGGTYDGQAQLFILKLSGPGVDGVWDLDQDYYVLNTGVQTRAGDSRNGLSTPQVVDYTGDYIADRIYAGDLFGNLWAFDVRGGPGSATIKKLFTTINQQAITEKPAVAYHPDMPYNDDTKPNLLVLFGSGQYLTQLDKSSTEGQYFYGLWDKQANLSTATTITLSQLVEQGPITTTSTTNGDYRVMPDPQAVAYTDPNSPKMGWYLPLPDSGERVISAPLALGRVVYFATTTPLQTACDYGVSGWLMGLDLSNGARTAQSIFDINNDYRVNSSDRVTVSGTSTVVSGQQQSGNLPSAPAGMGGQLYTTDNNGNLQNNVVGDGGATDALRRQSWRQLYYQQLK